MNRTDLNRDERRFNDVSALGFVCHDMVRWWEAGVGGFERVFSICPKRLCGAVVGMGFSRIERVINRNIRR